MFLQDAVHPTNENIAFGATNLGLYRTTNGGGAWTKLTSGVPAISATTIACCDSVIHPTGPNIAYCAFWADGIYKSTNATAATPTWTKLAGGLPASNLERIAVAVSPTAPNNVYALTASSGDSFGGFLPQLTMAAPGLRSQRRSFPFMVLTRRICSSTSRDIVYISGVEVYKASGVAACGARHQRWRSIHPDNHAFAGHPPTTWSFAGSDGGIYKSSNGGQHMGRQYQRGHKHHAVRVSRSASDVGR
jgi:hypothetical protein